MKKIELSLLQRMARIFSAFRYSCQGISAAWKHEAAFRDELLISLALTPVAILSSVTFGQKICLILSLVFVLIVELLNSAIEAVTDIASPGQLELAGRAKDLGSAAVFFALVSAAVVWTTILFG